MTTEVLHESGLKLAMENMGKRFFVATMKMFTMNKNTTKGGNMKIFCEFVLTLVVVFAFMILCALGHEADIRRQCIQTGHAGPAAWLGDFDCHIPNTQGKR